ncbi:MAG: hypothetical protein ACXVSX_19540 [Solirubrobacteraceae bacterium]
MHAFASRAVVAAALALAATPAAAAAGSRTVDVPSHAALTLLGEKRSDLAGASVAAAGDVNGDGRADVIVGAPLADPRGRRDAGSAYVVFGATRGRVSLGALGSRGFRIDGAVTPPRSFHPGSSPLSSGAGDVVAPAGDVNGDGLADVLVSGRTAANPSLPSAVYVVFGKRDTRPVDLPALGAGGFVIRGDGDFVDVLAGHPAGDVNGDGLADVAVPLAIDSDEDAGTVAIVFGKRDTATIDLSAGRFDPPTWGIRAVGAFSGLMLGSTDGTGAGVAAAGDVNGDGLGDVLLGASGAPQKNGKNYGTGMVFVLYGARNPGQVILRPGRSFTGYAVRSPRASEGFGAAVARLGTGFVAGAPGNPTGTLQGTGGVWVVRSRTAQPKRIAGPRLGGPVGFRVDVPGDVAGDGHAEILAVGRGRRARPVPAPLWSSNGKLVTTYTGLRNSVEARSAAAGAGNVGGNRRPDLIFGSPGVSAAYVLLSH